MVEKYIIRTPALKQSVARRAAEAGAIFLILGGLVVGMFIMIQFSQPDRKVEAWEVATMMGLVTPIPMMVFFLTPRQIIRISPRGVRVRSFGWQRSWRVDWDEVEACYTSENRVGIRSNIREYLLYKNQVGSEAWAPLQEAVTAKLRLRFGEDLSRLAYRSFPFRKPKTVAGRVSDFAILLLIGLGLTTSMLAAGYFTSLDDRGQTTISWIGTVMTTGLLVTGMLLLLRHFKQSERSRWRTPAKPCPECDYDLRSIAEPGCPECGWNRRDSPA